MVTAVLEVTVAARSHSAAVDEIARSKLGEPGCRRALRPVSVYCRGHQEKKNECGIDDSTTT